MQVTITGDEVRVTGIKNACQRFRVTLNRHHYLVTRISSLKSQ